MPYAPRLIRRGRPYELCFRARKGIPFPPTETMNLLLESAMARAQRDDKVEVCHHLWLGNHPHMIIVARDADQCKKFYMEVMKKVTDAVKRRLGLKHLTLWERRPMVAEILDSNSMIDRIAYLYLNPARAHLTASVVEYPGVSSYKAFTEAQTLESVSTTILPWIRLTAIPKMKSLIFSRTEDRSTAEELRVSAKEKHKLLIRPNAWMRCFGILSDQRAREINVAIAERIEREELSLIHERRLKGTRVLGRARLESQSITLDHEPKKRSRRIFVLASTKEARISFIELLKSLKRECRELFRLASTGARDIFWPPGMFPPAFPMRANVYVA